MAKRKTPTAGDKADSRKPKLDKVSIADANLANLRNLPTYFGQDGLKRNAHAQEGAKAATEALQYLEAGSVQEAVYHAMGAMMAVVRIERGNAKFMSEMYEAEVKSREALKDYTYAEINRKINREIARKGPLAEAHNLMREYHQLHPTHKKTPAAEWAAEQLKERGRTKRNGQKLADNYFRTILDNLPLDIQERTD